MTRPDTGDENSILPRYPVRVVAERLGVPTATLRSWTQRYGVGPSAHRPGRHRLYSEHDVAVVTLMHGLIRQGTNPGVAARSAMGAATPSSTEPASLLAAAFDLDVAAMTQHLDGHVRRHGVLVTWNKLVRPTLRELESRQVAGTRYIDVEHALSWAVAAAFQRLAVTKPRPCSIVLACTETEAHTLPLQAVRAALAEREQDALMLGADVPLGAIEDALDRRPGLSTLMLWSQTAATADRVTVEALTSRARVVLGGPGWDSAGIPEGAVHVSTLRAAVQQLAKAGRSKQMMHR